MKLSTLEVENFRRFGGRQGWTLAPVTLLTGANEVGKTTVIDALEFVLSGLTRTTDGSGAGRENLIHHGANRASVTITSADADSVTRTVPHSLSMSWVTKRIGVDEAQAELERVMGCSGKDAALTLRGRFWALDQKSQASLLFHLLGLKIRSEDVHDALELEDEKFPSFPLMEVAQELLGSISADLEGARRTCYDERTAVNRQHKSAKIRAEEERQRAQGVPRVEAPDAAALAAAQAEYERAHGALVERNATRKQRQDAEADLARQRAEQARLEGLLAQPLPDATALWHEREALAQEQRAAEEALEAAGQERVRALEAERAKLEQQLDVFARRQVDPLRDSCRAARAQLQSDLATAQRRAAAIRGTLDHEQCESCLQCVTGPAREAVEAALATLDAEAARCREALAGGSEDETKLDELEARLRNGRLMLGQKEQAIRETRAAVAAELRQLQAAHRPALAAAEKAHNDARVAVANREQHQESLSFVLAAIAALEERLAGMPPAEAEGADELQAALEQAKVRLGELQAQAREAAEYEATLARVRELDEEVVATETRSKTLTALVEFFGPNGFRLNILRRKLEPTLATLNRIVGAWGMEVRFDEQLEVQVRPRGSEAWLPWELISDSSQLAVALALQMLFAQETGLRIVGLDRLEAFDSERQAQLLQACLDLAERGEVDHIILSGVHVLAPVPEAVRHYHLSQEA